MKRIICSLGVMAMLASCEQQHGQILTVNINQKGTEVASTMYGIFFEEINHAGDGGLYAELIQNRGFEEHVIPSGTTYRNGKIFAPEERCYFSGDLNHWFSDWNMEEKKFQAWTVEAQHCKVEKDVLTIANPLHKNTPNALRLSISKSQDDGRVTLINSGYWGMGIKEGEKYTLRFYLRPDNYAGKVIAKITDATGTCLAEQFFNVEKGKEWQEFKAVLIGNKSVNDGNFQLEFLSKGTVYIDYVSLFPEHTFKNRPNGLRADLAQFLVDLKPAFMRWPGGCIVEGATLENRVKWKETLGDPMTRRGEWSLWGYRSTYGFGYHEFLQFCEDADMEGMFVANAGLACSIRNGDYISEKEIEFFLQDIQDAIEYAIGDANSKWGAMRIANGHPQPFPLKYVEIGNENSGMIYARYFNYMYEKLKAEYPQITFINTMSWKENEIEQIVKTDMVDPHWYENPEFFLGANSLFDDKERGKYKVYVGEYACNNGVGKGNMMAALSEAAFILGMERNSDFVTMTSYAPLIVNDNQPNWACNLIWTNSHQVMGRASYYVQKMSAENRPDYNVAISMNTSPAVHKDVEVGTFGLGTWNTQIEIKDIVLTQGGKEKPLGYEDFNYMKGTWSKTAEGFSQTSNETATKCLLTNFASNNYMMDFKLRKTGGNEGFLFYFGMIPEKQKGYVFNVAGWNNTYSAVMSLAGESTGGILGKQVETSIDSNKWHDVKLVVTPEKAVIYLDGKELLAGKAQTYPLQFFASGYDEKQRELILKVVNADSIPYRATYHLEGVKEVGSAGRVITLKANAAVEENSFDDPKKIFPIESKYDRFGKEFDYQFPPFSYTVLRIKATNEK